MAEKTVNGRIQIRNDTSTNWSSQNPILKIGEIGFESDTKRIKIGDGATAWNSLKYLDSDTLDGKHSSDFATAAQGTKADTAVQDSSYVHTDNNYTTADKTKLNGIAANANNYSLPVASTSVLGGVKVGSNLSVDADGILSATASGGVPIGYNLLDNSDFKNPVNQRVAGSYSGAGIYSIDRWKLWGGYNVDSHTLTFQSANAVSVAGLSACLLLQREAGISVGEMLTLSASVNSTVYKKTITITGSETAYNMGAFYFICGYNSDSAFFEIAITSGSISIEWAKLEKGSIATPYVPKGYGAELAECMRYARRYRLEWQMYTGGGGTTLVPLAFSEMRITPTATVIGSPYAFNCTQISFMLSKYGGAVTLNVVAAGATAYQATILLSADL